MLQPLPPCFYQSKLTTLWVTSNKDIRISEAKVVVMMSIVLVDALEEILCWLHSYCPRCVACEIPFYLFVLLFWQGLYCVWKVSCHTDAEEKWSYQDGQKVLSNIRGQQLEREREKKIGRWKRESKHCTLFKKRGQRTSSKHTFVLNSHSISN